MKKLPVGIQTFSEIAEGYYLYVDKTRNILNLINTGKAVFLSRPRRFGKSLLISTLESVFKGKKELFAGLYIYDKLEWKEYPVIKLDFSLFDCSSREKLEISVSEELDSIAESYSVSLESKLVSGKFKELIQKISRKEKAVILIDEYDKAIVDHLTDADTLQMNKEFLKGFYGILKGSDAFTKFAFLTGVSKFSQVSIFSGLNNISDITFMPEFSALLGYTQQELEEYFADRMDDLEKTNGLKKEDIIKNLRFWYNGYSWDGITRVYNPYSILNFFQHKQLRNFWFDTGTPTFLIDYIKKNRLNVSEIGEKTVPLDSFSLATPENIQFDALLFQTGYLTILKKEIFDFRETALISYPNEEVRNSFLLHTAASFLDHKHPGDIDPVLLEMKKSLRQDNISLFIIHLKTLFASVPYTLHLPYEAYYHSLFFMILKLLGCEIHPEVLTDKGRIDGILELAERIYIIEMKLDSPEKALEQIKNRKYAEKYINSGKKIILLGIGYLEKEISWIREEI